METQEIVNDLVSPSGTVPSHDDVPAIDLTGISKRFGTVEAVKDCSLRVRRGSFVSLLGPSGCGKTTLLRMIGGFERQDRGTILIHGTTVDRLPPNKRNVNTVFQRYALFPHKTVFENIVFTLEIMRVPKAERQRRVQEMLALVHLEGMETRRASQLSGGQAQRVALARALAGCPEVLLLDEPLAALDLKLRKAMQLELRRIQEEVGTTFLYVTHDQEEALTMSDTIVVMDSGKIVQSGSPAEIYEQPKAVFVSHFIGEVNLLHGEITEMRPEGVIVTVPGLKVAAPLAPGFKAGERVVLSIRPERLTAAPNLNGAQPTPDNRVGGIVERRIFLGHLVRFIIAVNPELVLTIEQPTTQAATLAVGAHVEVGWSSSAATVLREG